MIGLQDAVSVASVIISFQVVHSDNSTGGFDGRQGLVVVLLVRQTNQDWMISNELSHDLGLTSNGGTDLIGAHGEQVPAGFGTETNQVTSTGNALDNFLDVGISQVLGGQVEGDLGVLAVQVVQQLGGIISWAVIECEGDNSAPLTGVTDGSLGEGEKSGKNKSNVYDHDYQLWVCVCCRTVSGTASIYIRCWDIFSPNWSPGNSLIPFDWSKVFALILHC